MMAGGGLEGLAVYGDPRSYDTSDWFAAFDLSAQDVTARFVQPHVQTAEILGSGDRRLSVPPAALPNEPRAHLMLTPNGESGVVGLIAVDGASQRFIAAWPHFAGGLAQDIAVDQVLLSSDRRQAFVRGRIGDFQIAFHECFFAIDRGFYRPGVRHRYALTALAYNARAGGLGPVVLTPEAPNYRKLREKMPGNLRADGSLTIPTDGMVHCAPMEAAPPGTYELQGPVKAVRRYQGFDFDQPILQVVMALHRGVEEDDELDVTILMPERVIENGSPLAVGDDINALIFVQGAILQPYL